MTRGRAHLMGARAFRLGHTEASCPFADGMFRHCWLMGFINARIQASIQTR